MSSYVFKPKINRIGEKVNHLTVIGLDQEKSNQQHAGVWFVQCDCPKQTIFSTQWGAIKNRASGECEYCRRLHQSNNLIGQQFNYLTVLDLDLNYKKENNVKTNDAYWICKCKCGNIVSVSTQHLIKGHTQSCGCYHTEIVSKDLSGQIFGAWKVLKRDKNRYYKTTGESISYYICECLLCHTIKSVQANHLIQGDSLSCGCIKSKGEYVITQLLIKNNIKFECEKTFDNCKFLNSNRKAKFDFYINNSFLLEYDGQQHFKPSTTGFFTPEKVDEIKQKDLYKNQWCKENNIPLKRIPYWELDNITIENIMDDTFLIT